MKKHSHTTARKQRGFLTGSLLLISAIVAMDAYYLQSGGLSDPHAAAPSYVVCHAVTRAKPVQEQYFCSTQGCFSDEDYEVTVTGSYEDPNTCSGIADTLQEGADKAR